MKTIAIKVFFKQQNPQTDREKKNEKILFFWREKKKEKSQKKIKTTFQTLLLSLQ